MMMIRPLALLGCIAFLLTGFHVYSVKAEVDALNAELRRTLQATEAERVRTRTLSAEWARLNDQDRLQRLATTHLQELQPTTPQQFVRVADAGRRLPPATPFAGGSSAFRARADAPVVPGEVLVFSARTMLADAAAMPRGHEAGAPGLVADAVVPAGLVPAGLVPAGLAATRQPVAATPATPATPVTPATLASAPEAPPREAAPREATRDARPAAPRAAEARPTPPRPAPTALAEARPLPAPRAADPSLRTALHVRPSEAAPQGRPVSAPLAPPMGFGGSVLGGGGALPPPMPFGR